LSGYVTAYTTTENGKREPSDKLVNTPKQEWILSRVFGYYPLHLATLLLFSPMFLFADVKYNGWPIAALNGVISATLTQAWFPNTAEIWNAPTWFLSALTFATALMPFCLPSIAKMDKKALKKTAVWLTLASLLPKLGYLYDFGCWGIAEGWTSPKAHPNMAMFNMMRFSPLHISAEVILGAVACRYIMLDGADDDEQGNKVPKTNFLSTLLPLTGILAIMTARALDLVQVSDMVVRPLLFMPLFLKFLMAVHRNTVNSKTVSDPLVKFLSNNVLVWLGNLAFPIFVVHGPIGQVFYKKLIATKLFGKVLEGPAYFGLYLLSTLTMAYVMQKLVLQNKAIGNWSKKAVDSLSSWM
jgi:peptidoglycan/LPS O-acetylase OafA/YrhL